MTFKVVLVSNFDNPMVADKLLNQEHYEDANTAQAEADTYNSRAGDMSMYCARVKSADYVLYEFQP